MTALLMDRTTARRRTRVMAGLGALLLAGAAGVAALSFASAGPRASAETILAAAREQAEPPPAAPDSGPLADLAGAGANLVRIANKPVKPQPPPLDPSSPTPDPEPTPSADALANVRFIGVIRDPQGLVALASIGGRQRILRQGSAFKPDPNASTVARVVAITPDDLVVNDGSADRRLPRAPRTGPAVTYVGGATPALGVPGVPGATGAAYPGAQPGFPGNGAMTFDPSANGGNPPLFDEDGRMIPSAAILAAQRARAAAAAAAQSGDSAVPQAVPVFDDIKQKNEAKPQ